MPSLSYSVDDKTECRCHLQSIKEIMYKKLKIHPRFFNLHTQQSYTTKTNQGTTKNILFVI